jgi:tetratricopeptide (TPR) repeat protein
MARALICPLRAPPALLALFALVALLAPLSLAPPAARADDVGPQAIETYLARGQKLFDEQEYAAAIQSLAPVTRDARATRAQRLRALELVALAQFIRNDKAAARATFERILDIDPGYQLRDTSGSPQLRAFFDSLKKQLIPGYDPNAGADLEHAAPTAGVAGKPVELEVRVTRGNVFDLIVATRRRGELTYQHAPLTPRGDSRWRARITPAASSKPYVLEYYVEARDAGGAAIARIAAPDQPLEIALSAGGPDTTRRPWFTRWYVIAGGAVLGAGLGAVVVAATRGPGPGSLPPETVTVSP